MDHAPKDSVLVVEMGSRSKAKEELATVRISPCISHTQNTFVSVGIPYLLVVKLVSIDRFSASAVAHCGVTTLHHEAGDYSVELVAAVAHLGILWSVFASANAPEILTGLWNILEKLEHNALFPIIVCSLFTYGKVEEDLGIFWIKWWQSIFVLSNLCNLFFVVNTLREEFLHGSLL